MHSSNLLLVLILLASCSAPKPKEELVSKVQETPTINGTSLIVLGTIQDAGSPHIACEKECCKALFDSPDNNRKVVSLGVVDTDNNKKYLFEATPDIPEQLKMLKNFAQNDNVETPDGIFLTHAHIGHYSGLMYLGKEAMNANTIPVYAMPRMKNFLETNGPWSQLVSNNNIAIQSIEDQEKIVLSSNLAVVPFRVPHRDEYSETVGFKIIGPNKTALFIPDIDKWEKWKVDIVEEIAEVDYAFVDATFYNGEEINNRDISEIPHPFIIESVSLFNQLSAEDRRKIYFIHFNHTNPVLREDSEASRKILSNGFNITNINEVLTL